MSGKFPARLGIADWIGATQKQRALYWHYPHYHGSANRPSASVRRVDYKLVRWYEDGSEELYDLAAGLDHWLKSTKAKMAVPVAGN